MLFSEEGVEGARGVDAEGEEAEGDRSVFSVGPATNRTLVYAALAVSYRTYTDIHSCLHIHARTYTCTRCMSRTLRCAKSEGENEAERWTERERDA